MDSKTKDTTARSQIYQEMKPFQPNITDVNLRKKTERAQKILKLFDEGDVGMNRIKYVTYNAMGLKDTQIQHYYKSGDFKNRDKMSHFGKVGKNWRNYQW